MAENGVTTVCLDRMSTAVALEISDGVWTVGGDPHYLSRSAIFSCLSMRNDVPNIELTFTKAKNELGARIANFAPDKCTSLRFERRDLYSEFGELSQELKVWDNELLVNIPNSKVGLKFKLEYILLSLTGIPELEWKEHGLDEPGVIVDLEVSCGLGLPGSGKTEILVIFNPMDRKNTRMDKQELFLFEAKCKVIGDDKEKILKEKEEKDEKEQEKEEHIPESSTPNPDLKRKTEESGGEATDKRQKSPRKDSRAPTPKDIVDLVSSDEEADQLPVRSPEELTEFTRRTESIHDRQAEIMEEIEKAGAGGKERRGKEYGHREEAWEKCKGLMREYQQHEDEMEKLAKAWKAGMKLV